MTTDKNIQAAIDFIDQKAYDIAFCIALEQHDFDASRAAKKANEVSEELAKGSEFDDDEMMYI